MPSWPAGRWPCCWPASPSRSPPAPTAAGSSTRSPRAASTTRTARPRASWPWSTTPSATRPSTSSRSTPATSCAPTTPRSGPRSSGVARRRPRRHGRLGACPTTTPRAPAMVSEDGHAVQVQISLAGDSQDALLDNWDELEPTLEAEGLETDLAGPSRSTATSTRSRRRTSPGPRRSRCRSCSCSRSSSSAASSPPPCPPSSVRWPWSGRSRSSGCSPASPRSRSSRST